ncbi:uncharacterized protein RSE6_00896 [Rhynchosporium secalis]|uniref:Uncharacterized protein n=1 Tax=Rhynchosporium secalis TaxID=38038 RepID=A0A1E1LWD1_RHYSE|nr:uncharacterized protein RSE6_00896 [Rhynchosporium secalis]
MKDLTALSLLILSGSGAASIINSREYRPNEHLVLVDCGIGLLPNGASTSREMAYYPGSYNPGGRNTKWVQPEMIANVAWDGSYPWRRGGVTTKFPNGDSFSVWLNPDIKDWAQSNSYAGDAKHTYGNDFKCWAEHGKTAFTLADGKVCTSAYICFHPPDTPAPAPAPAPAPPRPVYKTKTNYTVSSKDITVRIQGTNAELEAWKPENAFRHFNDDDEGLQCKGSEHQIGSDCKIQYDHCFFAVRDNVEEMKSFLYKAIAPKVASSFKKKQGHYNGSCPPGGPCTPGYTFEYAEYTYPQTGTILVSVFPEGQESKSTTQALIHFRVICPNTGFCGLFCDNNLKDLIDFGTSLVGAPAFGSVVCSGC